MSPGSRVRPTAEAVRDRWLTLLAPDLARARVLELYAGTGALGIEALSRGAARIDFVENGPAALHALKANVAVIRAKSRTRIFKQDAVRFVERLPAHAYDLTIADPPYTSRQSEHLVERWLETPFSRVLTIEHSADRRLPGRAKRYPIGQTMLSFYRTARDESDR